MFNVIDAAFYYPTNEHAYFFRGDSYAKYAPGVGVVPLNGRLRRQTGIDEWGGLPAHFMTGVDAALYYPSRSSAYFFKGSEYVKYKDGEGVVPLSSGSVVRRIGIDGWTSFPPSFRTGLNAAVYFRDREHAYFFKGSEYIKYKPGQGVVPLSNGNLIRRVGIDGWIGLPAAFKTRIDAAIDYEPNDKLYFFRDRQYVRWTPGEGVDPRYPRRIGLMHGIDLVNGDRGGWFGLSDVVAGPTLGPVTEDTVTIWLWLSRRELFDRLKIIVGKEERVVVGVNPADTMLDCAISSIACGSAIRLLPIEKLSPATAYTIKLILDGVELDEVNVRTAPVPAQTGRVTFVCGSCSDMSKYADVPTFEQMANSKPDLAVFAGDNCYYVHAERTTGRTGPRPRDWESLKRMLLRHIQARNHAQFATLSRSTPLYATWDDHDFGYNNAAGADLFDWWVGRDAAAAVFRAIWPGNHDLSGANAIYQRFRFGPVEFFITDTRYHKNTKSEEMWGPVQLKWLLNGLRTSEAPVKVVVVATQFLFRKETEGHRSQAPGERRAVLDLLVNAVGASKVLGRVLFVSGDVHYTELLRMPTTGRVVELLEFTSSPLRRDVSGSPEGEDEVGSRLWAAKRDNFGIVTIDVQHIRKDSSVDGTITIEARGSAGEVLEGGDCRSVWDLGTGAIA